MTQRARTIDRMERTLLSRYDVHANEWMNVANEWESIEMWKRALECGLKAIALVSNIMSSCA